MKKNNGKEYEIWTKEIYEEIIKQEGFPGANIQHDVTIQGLTTSHQIDIFFSYNLAGTTHGIAFECKDYKARVSQEKIMAFKSKIDDIREVTKGIFVARNGFQKGAISFAKAHRIELIELREPKEIDWNGFIKTIILSLDIISINKILDIKLEADKVWKKEHGVGLSLVQFKGSPKNIYFYNDKLEKREAMSELINKLPVKNGNAGIFEHIYYFPDDTYILDNTNKFLKINSISFKYEVAISKQEIILDGGDSVKAIQKYPLTNEHRFISK